MKNLVFGGSLVGLLIFIDAFRYGYGYGYSFCRGSGYGYGNEEYGYSEKDWSTAGAIIHED